MAKTVKETMELTIFAKERKPEKGKAFMTYFATKNDGTQFMCDGEEVGETINIKLWDEALDEIGDASDNDNVFPVGVVVSKSNLYVKKKLAENAMGVTCIYYTIHIKSIDEVIEPVIKTIDVE